jgi:hypothetical protein
MASRNSRELPEAVQLLYYYFTCRSLFGVILVAVISIYRTKSKRNLVSFTKNGRNSQPSKTGIDFREI